MNWLKRNKFLVVLFILLIGGYSAYKYAYKPHKTIEELKQTIDLLSNTLVNQNLVVAEGEEILSVIKDYSKTWDILIKYDENRLELPKTQKVSANKLTYKESVSAIQLPVPVTV